MQILKFDSERFKLRTISPKDCTKKYLGWVVNEKFINYGNKNKTNLTIKNLKQNILQKKNPYFFAIYDKKKNHIGNIKFEYFSKKKNIFHLGILIGEKNWKYKGVFKEVFFTLVPHIYFLEKKPKIICSVRKDNLASMKSFKNMGWKIIYENKFKVRMYFNLKNKFHDISKIILGTAQLNNNYGYFKNRLINKKNIYDLLSLSKDYGIKYLDTSLAYNNLKIIEKHKFFSTFNIFLKIKYNHLQSHKKYNYYFKNFKLMFHGSDLENLKKKIKEKNFKKIVGCSIYKPSQLKILQEHKKIRIFQVPFNVLNREFLIKKNLKYIKSNKIILHCRSIFLQGILTNRKLPRKFFKFKNIHTKWFNLLDKLNLNPLNVCLNYALNQESIDKVVVGVNSSEQLKQIIQNLWIKKVDIPQYFSKVSKNFSNIDKWR